MQPPPLQNFGGPGYGPAQQGATKQFPPTYNQGDHLASQINNLHLATQGSTPTPHGQQPLQGLNCQLSNGASTDLQSSPHPPNGQAGFGTMPSTPPQQHQPRPSAGAAQHGGNIPTPQHSNGHAPANWRSPPPSQNILNTGPPGPVNSPAMPLASAVPPSSGTYFSTAGPYLAGGSQAGTLPGSPSSAPFVSGVNSPGQVVSSPSAYSTTSFPGNLPSASGSQTVVSSMPEPPRSALPQPIHQAQQGSYVNTSTNRQFNSPIPPPQAAGAAFTSASPTPNVQNGPSSVLQSPSSPPLLTGGYSQQAKSMPPYSPPASLPYPPNSTQPSYAAQPPPSMFGYQNGQCPPQSVPQYPGGQQPPIPSFTGPQASVGYPRPPGAYPVAGGPPGGYNVQGGAQAPYPGGQRPTSVDSPPQQRQLDPDQMPSPVQVIEDDRSLHSAGAFGTSKMGVLPPLVTTDAEIQDEGNAGPNYIRSTVYSLPCSPDVSKQTQVPIALAISPFARHARVDGALPVTVFSEEIVRCNRCKAYMCPFMQFVDGGRRFQCVFCKAATEVPQSYFNHLDHMGTRVDKWQRAELCLGSYEILATQEYCKNNVFPNPPAFIFVLDVSYNSVKCGLVQLVCQNIKDILKGLPQEEGSDDESGIRVGFITYASQVHFYNLDKRLSQPQLMVVPDVADMFVPFLEGCLVTPSEAMHVIESMTQEIPKAFADTRETETVLGPAIQAGVEALKAAECAGKLFVFYTSLPTAEAPGKLKNRDDRKLLGTDKEKTVLCPNSKYYQELAHQCVTVGCSVDLFVAHNAFVDLSSVGQVVKFTGGQIYKYTYFQSETDGERLLADLKRDVSKPIAFDAVMRVRTSTGLRPTDFFGNVYMQNTTDVELASIDCDKCVTVELKYDDKLPENESAFIQVALLYTSVHGKRKLRLHNLCLQTTQKMADLFRNCELDVVMNLFCKQALRQLLEDSPKSVRDTATLRAATILASYRKHCATASSVGQLILPECMKLLPLYTNCMMKCDALSGGPELTVDDRAFGMLSLSSMDVKSSQCYLYPRLLPVHNLTLSEADTTGGVSTNIIPVAVRTSADKLLENGAYILENGMLMFLYVGLQVDPEWCQGVFGVTTPANIDVDRGLPKLDTDHSRQLHRLIDMLRSERPRFMRLYLVRQGDKLELVLRQFLVEDRMSDAQPAYVDYLCFLHREIRNLIS